MRTAALGLALVLAAQALPGIGTAAPIPTRVPTVVVRPLPKRGEQTSPLRVGTTEDWSTELDFPWPVVDWRGRGFTPDPGRFSGDFMIDLEPGSRHFTVSALTAAAHRVLHVELAPTDGPSLTYPIEFVPEPSDIAPRRVTFTALEEPGRPSTAPDTSRPARGAVQPGAEEALLNLMRALKGLSPEAVARLIAPFPGLAFTSLSQPALVLPEFSVTPRYALTDCARNLTGLAVSLTNTTGKRILVDPLSWSLGSPAQVIRPLAVDTLGWTEPHEDACLCLVVAPALRAPADSPLLISAQVGARASAKPVAANDLPVFPAP